MYEGKQTEMMNEIMRLRQKCQQLETVSQTVTIDVQREANQKSQMASITQQYEQRSHQAGQQLAQYKAQSEAVVLQKTEEINRLLHQTKEIEMRYQQRISQMQSEWSTKERSFAQQA